MLYKNNPLQVPSSHLVQLSTARMSRGRAGGSSGVRAYSRGCGASGASCGGWNAVVLGCFLHCVDDGVRLAFLNLLDAMSASPRQLLSFGSASCSPQIPEAIIGMSFTDAQHVLSRTGKLIQFVKLGDRVGPEHNRNRVRVAVDADGKVRAFYCG